jgi:hypothetical protein
MSSVLVEGVNIVPAWAENVVDMDTNQTGDYISLKGYGKVGILFVKEAGTAGDDPTLSVYQAKDVAGTDVKDLNGFATYWIKQAATNLTAVGTFTKTTQTADEDLAFNATSAEQCLIMYCEIDAEDLDVDNGFDCIRVDVALAASGGAQWGTCLYFLMDPRYPQATSLSAIAD